MRWLFILASMANLLTFAHSGPVPSSTQDSIIAVPDLVSRAQPTSHRVLWKNTAPGVEIKGSKKLRILTIGDSITAGFPWRGDGNGYRGKLREDLSKNDVVFAGTITTDKSTMKGNHYAAWPGKTIKYISDRVDASLAQRPNIILLAAGTNDMNSNTDIATEGNDPANAAARLGNLIDKMVTKCPDASILVSLIMPTCGDSNHAAQNQRTTQFQKLTSEVVKKRFDANKKVLAVDFVGFWSNLISNDCVHPSEAGYYKMGDSWYDFITQIPSDWIKAPTGPDPTH
ncbi:unnamed protein product [Clonostachys chloroleuca]|uniref:SGNH hydrolase-type esterase domain-containing protein n=1 Tax=Clonostachys chloroleuca TaxID=1926264 RepID=A0AA35MCP0_9HYPO|nr:unnamed protein product [Clonostachys chloroleuca]